MNAILVAGLVRSFLSRNVPVGIARYDQGSVSTTNTKGTIMFVITFSNPKGGTGKTTANMILAEQIANRGGRVTILDCDPNTNIVDWAANREDEGKPVPFRVIPRVEKADDFFDQLEGEGDKADFCLIDLEGTADQLTTFATQAADLVIVPMTLTYMEARQAQRAVKVVKQMARASRRNIKTALLLNRTSTAVQSGDHRQMRQALVDGGADVLPVELMNRAAFDSMFQQGLTLGEMRARLEEQTANLSDAGRARKLKPILSAIENAEAYAEAVFAHISEARNAA